MKKPEGNPATQVVTASDLPKIPNIPAPGAADPKPRGVWIGYHQTLAYERLAAIGVGDRLSDEVVGALSAAGLLVSSAYYVPTMDDLYDSWRQMRKATSGRPRLRWVMCAETWAALVERNSEPRRVPVPADFPWSYAVVPDAAWDDGPKAVFVIDTHAGKLFDEPVRLDPAARRPMWELP